MAIAARFAASLIRKQLLPEDQMGDARILSETALEGLPLLVTFDRHLPNVDEDELRLALDEADLLSVSVADPQRLLRAIR